ncbi:hypothetical protein D8S93_18940 [Vibrio sp. VGrn 2]|uniref:hypothetical protein n=1 Tax=Vibrio sp. VGrn 2 TaxID=2419839 RepID=UPI00128C84E2|nr:hypothetical protein [Vibrio sp. VGrn 2]MPS40697.1 hypothetical protein [Vibrio sp. VGrn 2]
MDRDKILRAKASLLESTERNSLLDVIQSDAEAFKGSRVIYSTDNAGAPVNNFKDENLFADVFSRSKLLVYSEDIMAQMNSGQANLAFKQRALFDTNLVSDLPKYFRGEDLTTKDRVEKILGIVTTQLGGGYDFGFPMLENLRFFVSENCQWPIYKVAAAHYLDEKILNTPVGKKEFSFETTPEMFEKAQATWEAYRSSSFVWKQLDRRDLVYLLMLKTMNICWDTPNVVLENALHDLVEFCLKELNVLPLKELYFAWKALIGFIYQDFTPVFNEPHLKSPKEKSLERIRALSWDLFLFRYTETLLSEEKGNTVSLPCVTTLDKELIKTMKLCKVKAVLMYEQIGFVETIFEDEGDFQVCLNASMNQHQKSVLRKQNRQVNDRYVSRYTLQKAIARQERMINKMIRSAK